MHKKRQKLSTYERRGVSSQKEDVHKATSSLDKGLFPGAFCKILPDVLGGSPSHCNILHPDTAGTKASLAYLAWRTTGNLGHLRGIPVDALVMNVDDVGCVGAVQGILVDQTINRNSFQIKDEIKEIIESAEQFCAMLRVWRINCHFASGETASVPDLVRTFDVGTSVAVRMKRKDVIDASRVVPGDIIVGFSSTGQARWEAEQNSGIGSNGLTNARHETLAPFYRKFTQTYAPEMDEALVYRGKYRLEDRLPEDRSFTIAGALLSPTRTYLPLIKMILEAVPRRYIHGIIHCSGGGQTKIRKFGRSGNRYVKYRPFPVPAVFKMIQEVSKLSWREMYEVFNMGWRLEMVVPDMKVANDIRKIAMDECDISAKVVGAVEEEDGPNQVIIETPSGQEKY